MLQKGKLQKDFSGQEKLIKSIQANDNMVLKSLYAANFNSTNIIYPMKTNKTTFNILYVAFLISFIMIISCKENMANVDKASTVNLDSKKTEKILGSINLEEIPFKLPENWIYKNSPIQGMKNLSGYASNKAKDNVTVTVWDFPVDNLDSLEVLFKKDMTLMGYEVRLTVRDTFIDGLSITPDTQFKWIGKTFKRKRGTCLVAVGATIMEYPNNQKMIETIFNSVIEK